MKDCENCRYVTTGFDVPPCSECVCESKWEQPTNADRIRAMTDEELAEWMAECNAYNERANAIQWLPWLKQPYGGADHE